MINSNHNQNNFYPNQDQKLLLQAALWQGETAIDSWQKWRKSVDIDDVDRESYRLLPLLYRNLSTHNVTDSYIGRLKGIYRRTWVENQVWFQQLGSILRSFQEAGIEIMLLKDAALNLYYYQDNGLRFINHLDFIIHPKDVLTAIKLLQNLGWITKGQIPNPTATFSHFIGLENKSKQYLSLRWHLFADGFDENAENEFWQGALPTQVSDFPVYVLCPTHQLFYTCGSEIFRNSVLPARQLADAAIAINSYPDRIDWNQLIKLAQNYRVVLPLKTTLIKLYEILNVPIPATILQELKNLPISHLEKQEYQIFTGEKITVLARFKMRYFQYLRTTNNSKFNLFGFVSYLQYVWGLEKLWEVPMQATIRSIKGKREREKGAE